MGDGKGPSIQYLLLQHKQAKKNGQWEFKEKIKSDLSSQLLKKNLLVENKSTNLIHEIMQFANRQGNQRIQRSNGLKGKEKIKGYFQEKDEVGKDEVVTNNSLGNYCGYGYVLGKYEDKGKNFDIRKFEKEDANRVKEHVINGSTENDRDYTFKGGDDICGGNTEASVINGDNLYTASLGRLDENDTDGNSLDRDGIDGGSFDRRNLEGCSFEGCSFDGFSTNDGNIYKSGMKTSILNKDSVKTIRFDLVTSNKDGYNGNCFNRNTDDKNTVEEGTVDKGSLSKDGDTDGGDFIVDYCNGNGVNKIFPDTDGFDRGGLDKVGSHHDGGNANTSDTYYNLNKINEN